MKIVSTSTLSSARERYEAARRGQYIPPPKPQVKLTDEEQELFIDKLAEVFAKMYMEGHKNGNKAV